MPRLALLLLLGLLPCLVQARFVKVWTPDDLLPVSSLICNGVVVKVDNLGDVKELSPGVSSATRCKAHIKVLSIFKGVAPAELDFFYTEGFDPGDGPMDFRLKKGQRYRFFLNSAAQGHGYISALDSNYDNLCAVEILGTTERDNSPPLFKEEALRIALAFFNLHPPEVSPSFPEIVPILLASHDAIGGDADPNIWSVEFYFRRRITPASPDGEVKVLGDRTISSDSWIALDIPSLSPAQITGKNSGWLCLLFFKANLKDKFFENYGSADMRGTIQGITKKSLILVNVQDKGGNNKSAKLVVPLADLQSIRLVLSSSSSSAK